jgi:hypothetical protein
VSDESATPGRDSSERRVAAARQVGETRPTSGTIRWQPVVARRDLPQPLPPRLREREVAWRAGHPEQRLGLRHHSPLWAGEGRWRSEVCCAATGTSRCRVLAGARDDGRARGGTFLAMTWRASAMRRCASTAPRRIERPLSAGPPTRTPEPWTGTRWRPTLQGLCPRSTT